MTVAGLGHHRPGGALDRLPERLAGPCSDRIDAADLIWELFERHRSP